MSEHSVKAAIERCRAAVRICPICGNPIPRFDRSYRKFCSRKCGKTARRNANLVDQTRRFWSYVDRKGENDCWPWKGARMEAGYGHARYNLKTQRAHRVAYELAYGSLSEDQFVCHKCDNPPCCNPAHLFPGTHTDNMRDALQKGRLNLNPRREGERHPAAKINSATALQIFNSSEPTRVLARRYNVSQDIVYDIRNGRTWSSVTKALSDIITLPEQKQ